MQRGALLVSDRVKWAGIALIAATGLIHLIEAPEYIEFATYLGVVFLLNVVWALVGVIKIDHAVTGGIEAGIDAEDTHSMLTICCTFRNTVYLD